MSRRIPKIVPFRTLSFHITYIFSVFSVLPGQSTGPAGADGRRIDRRQREGGRLREIAVETAGGTESRLVPRAPQVRERADRGLRHGIREVFAIDPGHAEHQGRRSLSALAAQLQLVERTNFLYIYI